MYQHLDLHQKQLRYTSQDKLITCLVSIMSGCQSISHIDTRIRPDRALAQAWGMERFAHQSIVADTLNRFTEIHVAQLRQAVNTIYLREGRAVRHDYTTQGLLILDVDLTGLPASKNAEGSRKGYFSGKKGGRGRQLARVSAPQYHENLLSLLYPGNQTSEKSLFETIQQLEALSQLYDRHQRGRILIRLDAGFGNDQNINWLLHRGYQVLSKHKSSKRASLIASQVVAWYPLDDRKWIAQVPKPLCHRYYRRTQTAVLCWYNANSNMFKHALLVCSLLDLDLLEISHLYDERASIETEIKADKGGLLLPKRRKKQFEAQEALVLLTDLAHSILAWSRDFWAAEAKIGDLGIYGIINKIMTIPGKLTFEDGKLVKARLQATHPLAKPVISCLSRLLRDF